MFIQEKRDRKFIAEALKIAEDVEKFGNSRHAALLVCRNNIVSYGTNHNPKTHPFALKFGKNEWAVHLHAETEAIKNAHRRGFSNFHKTTLYVVRAKYKEDRKTMTQGISMPCDGCMECIRYFGIERVVFTLDQEGIAILHLTS